MANNINKIYDQYSSEDYLCYKLKPRGELLCGYCHEPYIPVSSDDFLDVEDCMTVCRCCGEVCQPYEEE